MTVTRQQLVWREYRSPSAVLDFNAARPGGRAVRGLCRVLSRNRSTARDDLWLQVASDHQSKVYVNGRQVYRCHLSAVAGA